MLAKRPAPVIGKLTNSIMSGGICDSSTSPKSPSEFKILSPRGLINYDLGGIGLGIVAAMEKYVDDGKQVPANKLFCRRNSSRSNPIPVNSPKNSIANRGVLDENGEDSLEDYTFVTGLGPDNKMFARVYYDGDSPQIKRENQTRDFDRRRSNRHNPSLFTVSPAGFGDFPDFPASDFLNSCHMCQKKLHGKDIYMYRGEKAFCSTDCRYKQIVMDEKQEKCSSGFAASRSVEVSSSPCYSGSGGGRIFSPGILAI